MTFVGFLSNPCFSRSRATRREDSLPRAGHRNFCMTRKRSSGLWGPMVIFPLVCVCNHKRFICLGGRRCFGMVCGYPQRFHCFGHDLWGPMATTWKRWYPKACPCPGSRKLWALVADGCFLKTASWEAKCLAMNFMSPCRDLLHRLGHPVWIGFGGESFDFFKPQEVRLHPTSSNIIQHLSVGAAHQVNDLQAPILRQSFFLKVPEDKAPGDELFFDANGQQMRAIIPEGEDQLGHFLGNFFEKVVKQILVRPFLRKIPGEILAWPTLLWPFSILLSLGCVSLLLRDAKPVDLSVLQNVSCGGRKPGDTFEAWKACCSWALQLVQEIQIYLGRLVSSSLWSLPTVLWRRFLDYFERSRQVGVSLNQETLHQKNKFWFMSHVAKDVWESCVNPLRELCDLKDQFWRHG